MSTELICVFACPVCLCVSLSGLAALFAGTVLQFRNADGATFLNVVLGLVALFSVLLSGLSAVRARAPAFCSVIARAVACVCVFAVMCCADHSLFPPCWQPPWL
jgi:hypothetical protein